MKSIQPLSFPHPIFTCFDMKKILFHGRPTRPFYPRDLQKTHIAWEKVEPFLRFYGIDSYGYRSDMQADPDRLAGLWVFP